jgi:integrase
MRIADLDLENRIWLIPGASVKNRTAHLVPLCPIAIDLLKRAIAMRVKRESEFVFPGPRNALVSIHPDALTRAMGRVMKALGLPLAGPHDLRRTGSSVLASERGRVTPFIVSQILNHISDPGGGSPVTRLHYNVYLYAKEKRGALKKWEKLVTKILAA